MGQNDPFPMVCVILGLLFIQVAIAVENVNSTEFLSPQSNTSRVRIRDGRFNWFPFLVLDVSVPNTPCTGDGNPGLCYTRKQCRAIGGTDRNTPCAKGYGTCCTFIQSCTGYPGMTTVNYNLTRVSGTFSNGTQQPCQIKIPKKTGVCQLRIDFMSFNIISAERDGTCMKDTVTFSGASNLMPNGLTLCGTATNQHLYMDYGDADTMSISANLMQAGSMYDFLITMIKCDSIEKAPDGCTQYYTSPRQSVMSFNYPNQQLNSQRYTVCVKSPGNSITWSGCPNPTIGEPTPFFITGMPSSLSGSLTGDACQMKDIVVIPPGNIRCGTNFSEPVMSTVKPFVLYVNFDDHETPAEPVTFDPTTGCPLGYTCVRPIPPPMEPYVCGPGDTCEPPEFMSALVDDANTGFCLTYAVS